MTMPFYSSVDQLLRDRSELARKGIARGRSVVVLTYTGGVLFVAENRSSTLHKVSEIYDRIGFAAVGRYNEFEKLRNAGIRMADVRGYSYDRRDVTGRMLANAYAQVLGTSFVEQQKPYEVELCLAGVGATARGRPALPHHLRRLDHRRTAVRGHGRHHRPDQRQAQGHLPARAGAGGRSRSRWRAAGHRHADRRRVERQRRGRGPGAGRERVEVAVLDQPGRGGPSAASPAGRCASCSRSATARWTPRPARSRPAATTPGRECSAGQDA